MNCIDRFRHEVKSRLFSHRVFDWREEIPPQLVELWRQELAPKTRHRLWTMELMLWFWILAGVHREKAFRAVTTEVWAPLCREEASLAQLQVNEGRMAEGRSRVPLEMIRRAREEFARRGVEEGRGMGLWQGRRIVWVDGTTVSLADSPPLRHKFGRWVNQHGAAAFPLARLVMWGVASTRIVIGCSYGPMKLSEKELALRSLPCVRVGDVVVMDRLYASAELFAEIRRRGADALTRINPQLKLQKHPRRKLGRHEWIVDLPLDLQARRRDSTLPGIIRIRVLKATTPAGRHLWLQTTLLDPQRHPARELMKIYLQRWGVETSYAEVKADLHLAVIRSETVDGVNKEIEAHLAAYNYVRLQMLRAALRANVDPLRLSFRKTVRLLLTFTLLSRTETPELPSDQVWNNLLDQIARGLNPPRPGRHEPRAIKRRSTYHRWKGSRKAWRESLNATG
jgi:hypothetical protein